MPRPDPTFGFDPPRFHRGLVQRVLARRRAERRRRGGGRDLEADGGVPVEPNGPKTLSGGAAAALEFDD